MYDLVGAFLDETLNGFIANVVGRVCVWLATMTTAPR